MNWMKRKGTTGKVEPSKKFLEEGKFRLILEHDIPAELVFNLDQTPLSYVSSGNTLSSKRFEECSNQRLRRQKASNIHACG